jgi:hypothetical protein
MDAIALKKWLLENGPVKTSVYGPQRRLFSPRTDNMIRITSKRSQESVIVRKDQYDKAVNAIIEQTRRQSAMMDRLRSANKAQSRKSRKAVQLSLLDK